MNKVQIFMPEVFDLKGDQDLFPAMAEVKDFGPLFGRSLVINLLLPGRVLSCILSGEEVEAMYKLAVNQGLVREGEGA
ncbi:MAG TPA: hypothetical protein P5280_10160 [Cyclobacteriaceae bacterium]|nr:hypothetical protein [Cyclobacteriaceae bacterium]